MKNTTNIPICHTNQSENTRRLIRQIETQIDRERQSRTTPLTHTSTASIQTYTHVCWSQRQFQPRHTQRHWRLDFRWRQQKFARTRFKTHTPGALILNRLESAITKTTVTKKQNKFDYCSAVNHFTCMEDTI